MKTPPHHSYTLALVLCGLTLVLWLLGLSAGSRGFETDLGWSNPIIQDIRLPRTLGAWLAGALLGLAGALAQGLFRNPLADPYLLGSASGAALGVALTLALGAWGGAQLPVDIQWVGPWVWRLGLTGAAFAGAWGAVLLTLLLASGVQHTLRLLLAGVVVGVVLGALTSLLSATQPQLLPAMQSFLLGNTGMVNGSSCLLMAAVLVLCWLTACRLSPLLDGLTLGEDTARSLGLPVASLRMLLLAVMALCTATAVAQTGLIAFVGLVAPHLVRSRVRVRFAMSSLLSTLTGGVLLCLADILARTVMAPRELPVGVLTAVMGGAYLMWRLRSHISHESEHA
ncbi:MAG: iron ABC transporter permease [Limnohabitans sp.]|nr:iron ABC transporter permease [Limnohabitans sp.]